MNVLITGGTGFIGRELCKQLFHNGHCITVLTRHLDKVPEGLAGARVIDRLEDARNIDAVVNLAGENLADGRWTSARKQAFRDSRLGTTAKLLGWIQGLERRPSVLVSGSAIGYYGHRGDEPLSEDADPGQDSAAILCRDWEATALQAQDLGVRVCIARIGIVLGPEGGALEKMLPPFKMGVGGPLGRGDQIMSWVRRADLVRLIQWLIETDSCQGAYNATAPEPVSNREFAHTLGKILGRPSSLPTPAFALRMMFGEMADLLLTGQRVLPTKALAEGFVFKHVHLEQALRDLVR